MKRGTGFGVKSARERRAKVRRYIREDAGLKPGATFCGTSERAGTLRFVQSRQGPAPTFCE